MTKKLKRQMKGNYKLKISPKNMKKQKGLRQGFYKIYWLDGSYSLASIGQTYDGTNWFAQCNWVCESNKEPKMASTKWRYVEKVERINTEAIVK